MLKKTIKHNQDLHVDQEKAFTRVNGDKRLKIIEQYDVKGQLLSNIGQSMFKARAQFAQHLESPTSFQLYQGLWRAGFFPLNSLYYT